MNAHPAIPGPCVWLLSSPSAWDTWKRLAERIEAEKLFAMPLSDHPFSPWISITEGRAQGSRLADRLANGQRGVLTLDDPLLPDPRGASEAVFQWLSEQALEKNVILHILRPEHWHLDSIDTFLYLARRLETEHIAILADATALMRAPLWRRVLETLKNEIGFSVESPQSHAPDGPDPIDQVQTDGSIKQFASCGAHHAARALLEREDLVRETWKIARFRALLSLSAGDDAAVELATTRMSSLAPNSRARALSLRIRMLSMHRLGNVEGMVAAVEAARHCHADSSIPRGWVCLDEALAHSLISAPQSHIRWLDLLLSLPDADVSLSCRATAFIWRAAAAYSRGEGTFAADALSAALPILDQLGEVTRATHVRLRLGLLLSALDRSADGARMLRTAAASAIALGDMNSAAVAATEAACAAATNGEPALMAQVAAFCGWKAEHVGAEIRAAKLHYQITAYAALASGRLDDVLDNASYLEKDAYDQPRLCFEAAILRLLVASRQRFPTKPYVHAVTSRSKMLGGEEQPLALIRLAHIQDYLKIH
jgi:hypothetical protein